MIELNKDGLAASEGWMQHQSATFGLHWKNAKPIIEAYFDTIHDSDAPALALAILEAAGVESAYRSAYNAGSDWQLEHAVNELSEYVRARSEYEAEAEAQAKLEAEALELLNANRDFDGLAPIESWNSADDKVMDRYLNLARRAREINKEEK